ncbi:KinB-signaling pathway activation protein [Paenibacillus turpanensis]|uniref:KinB-signaling pathway activation protein n=1 Tax=Paenibacillus turpanensis TaxID=2689078 RepID=UPI00140D5212|nr:KinB-signaling pathway activation protein [Paenibacillus turpanensis]
MNIRKWVYLFMSSLGIGAAASLLAWVVLIFINPPGESGGVAGVGYNIISVLLAGMLFSIISQTGFFAYLTLNYIARSIFRRPQLWIYAQLIITAITVTYLPFMFTEPGEALLPHIAVPVIVLIVAIAVAFWKVKLTNKSAFVPTVFFMSAVTLFETIPSLRENHFSGIFFMILPLLACNAWQILILGKLLSTPKSPSQS